MITAKVAREKSIETQMRLVEDSIQNSTEGCGFKSICISAELEESLYDEVILELLHNGFDIIFKQYTDRVDEIISLENGKEENGLQILLDCRSSDFENDVTTYYPYDSEDDGSDYYYDQTKRITILVNPLCF